MELVKIALPLVIQGSVAALVLSVGLNATWDDAVYILRRPALFGRAFLAISVIVPLVAVLVVRTMPISVPSQIGVMLMALSPVPPLATGKALKLGGHKPYVYSLYIAFAVLAVAIVPVTLEVLERLFGASAEAPMGKLVGVVIFTVLAPFAIGMMLHARWPARASAAATWVGRIALWLILIAFVALVARAWPAMVAMTGDGTLAAITAIVVAGVIAGHLLGGPDLADRVALANTAATRHPGIALMIATANFADQRVTAIILMFALVSMIVMAIYQAAMKRIAHVTPTPAARAAP
jgi:BASS family bile acid:Na+ symporter